MSTGIAVPIHDFILDNRMVVRKFKMTSKRNKWIGFCCSLAAHIILLTAAGIILIKPAQFGVDKGLAGMEVQLVAGTDKPVVDIKPIVQEEPVVKEEAVIQEKKIEQPPEKVIEKSTLGNSTINASSSGGAIVEAKPDYLSNPAPAYPYKARQNGWEGVVILKVLVNPQGLALNVQVEQSSGHSSLDESAVKAVKSWKFRPGQLGNIPVESSVQVPVRFELKDSAL